MSGAFEAMVEEFWVARRRGEGYTDAYEGKLALDDAYRLQLAIVDRRVEAGERQIKIFFPELVALFAPAGQMTRCHRRRSRYPHSTSSADSFVKVRRLVAHGEHAGVPRP